MSQKPMSTMSDIDAALSAMVTPALTFMEGVRQMGQVFADMARQLEAVQRIATAKINGCPYCAKCQRAVRSASRHNRRHHHGANLAKIPHSDIGEIERQARAWFM